MQEVLNLLHDQQRVQGVVVFRGIAGFGDSGEVHASDLLRLNVDLPLVVEFFFDRPAVAEAAMKNCWTGWFQRVTSSTGQRPFAGLRMDRVKPDNELVFEIDPGHEHLEPDN